MKINIAEASVLSRLLNRTRNKSAPAGEMDPGILFREILTWANRLVPSEAGSIMLDDPLLKFEPLKEEKLYFAACFGKGSSSLAGTSLAVKKGIFAETYRRQRPYISKEVESDSSFFPRVDRKTGYRTSSIICAPIIINRSTIGVIEMINRKGSVNYDSKDLAMLEIFAGYTATLIHNALIARNFEEISIRDDLTGLYNDRHFFHCLENVVRKALVSKADVTVLFFDLDRFKEVNDVHGHLAGSAVLREIGGLVREIFLKTNAVASRYGGDEYVVILPDMSLDTASVYAEKIRARIERNIFLCRRHSGLPALKIKGIITCSIGIASLSESISPEGNARRTADKLIRAADKAMYAAKDMGKNKVYAACRPGD